MFGGYKTSKNNYWLPLGNAGLLTAKYRFNKPTNTQENEDDERAKYLFHDKSTSCLYLFLCEKKGGKRPLNTVYVISVVLVVIVKVK